MHDLAYRNAIGFTAYKDYILQIRKWSNRAKQVTVKSQQIGRSEGQQVDTQLGTQIRTKHTVPKCKQERNGSCDLTKCDYTII